MHRFCGGGIVVGAVWSNVPVPLLPASIYRLSMHRYPRHTDLRGTSTISSVSYAYHAFQPDPAQLYIYSIYIYIYIAIVAIERYYQPPKSFHISDSIKVFIHERFIAKSAT